jgi:hypothetical protein
MKDYARSVLNRLKIIFKETGENFHRHTIEMDK